MLSCSCLLRLAHFLRTQTAAFRSGAAAREAIRQNAAWEAAALLKRQQDEQAQAAQVQQSPRQSAEKRVPALAYNWFSTNSKNASSLAICFPSLFIKTTCEKSSIQCPVFTPPSTFLRLIRLAAQIADDAAARAMERNQMA